MLTAPLLLALYCCVRSPHQTSPLFISIYPECQGSLSSSCVYLGLRIHLLCSNSQLRQCLGQILNCYWIKYSISYFLAGLCVTLLWDGGTDFAQVCVIFSFKKGIAYVERVHFCLWQSFYVVSGHHLLQFQDIVKQQLNVAFCACY